MKKNIRINNKKGELNMAIKERDIRDVIGDWKLGEKFIITKNVNTKAGRCLNKYVGKTFTFLCTHTDYALFISDSPYNLFIQVPCSIAVTVFKKVEKEEDYPEYSKEVNNSEYFTDNTFFNTALSRADVIVQTIFHKTTVVAVRFANGFVIVESSSCVHENDYNKELGIKLCMQKIEQKYMEYRAFEVCDNTYGYNSVYNTSNGWDSAE